MAKKKVGLRERLRREEAAMKAEAFTTLCGKKRLLPAEKKALVQQGLQRVERKPAWVKIDIETDEDLALKQLGYIEKAQIKHIRGPSDADLAAESRIASENAAQAQCMFNLKGL
jgi:hypothetical protein